VTSPFKQDYAFGLEVRTEHGHTAISHGGGIEGFNTQMSYYPDDKLTIIVLGNLNGGAPGDIAAKLASVAHGEQVILQSERKEISVPKEVLAQYVGTYELSPTFSIVITLEGDHLMAQPTNQSKIPLFAESQTKFFHKAVDAQIEFFKDENGKVASLTLYQAGRETKGVKK
jgi:hypothetical protein